MCRRVKEEVDLVGILKLVWSFSDFVKFYGEMWFCDFYEFGEVLVDLIDLDKYVNWFLKL